MSIDDLMVSYLGFGLSLATINRCLGILQPISQVSRLMTRTANNMLSAGVHNYIKPILDDIENKSILFYFGYCVKLAGLGSYFAYCGSQSDTITFLIPPLLQQNLTLQCFLQEYEPVYSTGSVEFGTLVHVVYFQLDNPIIEI